MGYDPENIFAKILRAEIPSFKVFEDDATFAFMDIMPRADGHMLVIPKDPARNMLDATVEQLAACLSTLQTLSHAAMRAFDATGITLQQFNEADGGQEVFHLHFHILPRQAGIKLRPPGIQADLAVVKAHADRIIAAL